MLRIRLKMGPARNKEWTCCFGLHVRTATIMIGMWHLFLNVLTLGILAAIMRNPAMMQELETGDDDYNRMETLPTPLSKIEPPYAYRDHSLNYQNVDMGGIVCVCMIAISLMLIYGAVKYKPSHLLPFFCLLLFDFAITTLTAAGYVCYLRNRLIHRIIDENHRFPWRDELLKISPKLLSIIVLLVFLIVVLPKAYAIGIVWRCYKYLTMRQHNIRTMLPYIIPEMPARQQRTLLLPDYDEAMAQYMKQPPPPYYQVASATNHANNEDQPMQYQTAIVTIPAEHVDDHTVPPAYDEASNHYTVSTASEIHSVNRTANSANVADGNHARLSNQL